MTNRKNNNWSLKYLKAIWSILKTFFKLILSAGILFLIWCIITVLIEIECPLLIFQKIKANLNQYMFYVLSMQSFSDWYLRSQKVVPLYDWIFIIMLTTLLLLCACTPIQKIFNIMFGSKAGKFGWKLYILFILLSFYLGLILHMFITSPCIPQELYGTLFVNQHPLLIFVILWLSSLCMLFFLLYEWKLEIYSDVVKKN